MQEGGNEDWLSEINCVAVIALSALIAGTLDVVSAEGYTHCIWNWL